MKIGIDIDDTTLVFFENFCKFYNQKTGKSYAREDLISFHFWNVFNITREEAIRFVEEFHQSDEFNQILPMENAIDSIKSLMEKNEVYFITARPKEFKSKTLAWLDMYFPNFDYKLIFTGHFHDSKAKLKGQICKELGIEILIDDNFEYCIDCVNNGVKAILFNQPWNQSSNHDEIIRVNSWKEALHNINKLTKKP